MAGMKHARGGVAGAAKPIAKAGMKKPPKQSKVKGIQTPFKALMGSR